MAITPNDFSKIWASNADTPEYTFTEANYLKGWDFVGNLPPTRAQWNAIQKSTDEKMKYVFDNFGAPLTASTVAEMTMQNRVYVYTGSETGYTAGHWYYWNGSWTDGGVYNSNTVQVDSTLTISGAAADAQVTGYKFTNIEEGTINILDIQDKTQRTTNGITWSIANQVITASGTSTGNGDITLTLKTPLTLGAGSYRLSFNTTLGLGNVTVNCYFHTNVGTKTTSSTNDIFILTLTAQETLDYIIIRFTRDKTVNFQVKAQLTAGNFPPINYMSNVSAKDVNLREEIFARRGALDYLSNQVIVQPIFCNGFMDVNTNYLPQYTNTNLCLYGLITDAVYDVKAGSRINFIGDTYATLTVNAYNVDGSYKETLLNKKMDVSEKNRYFFKFTEDARIRIFIRYANYRNAIPANAFELFEFSLITEMPKDEAYRCKFVGMSSPNNQTALSGQMQLIRLPNGKNLLLDSHKNNYYNAVHDVLRNAGVRRIDYYVQSHWHSDHIGLLQMLKTEPTWVDISNMVVFLPQLLTLEDIPQIAERETVITAQNEMIGFLEQNNCTIIRPTEGQTYDLTDDITLRFYNTDHSVYSDNTSGFYSTNYNDWSLCCELLYGKTCINFSADIGPIGQRHIAGTLNKANILTAPHHGWDNGANNLNPRFINNVNPDTVISVNGWEHDPDNVNSSANIMLATSAMQSYCEANCVSNYPTFLNGAIDITVDKNGWEFNGQYSRYIRNGKNWKYNDNTDKQE